MLFKWLESSMLGFTVSSQKGGPCRSPKITCEERLLEVINEDLALSQNPEPRLSCLATEDHMSQWMPVSRLHQPEWRERGQDCSRGVRVSPSDEAHSSHPQTWITGGQMDTRPSFFKKNKILKINLGNGTYNLHWKPRWYKAKMIAIWLRLKVFQVFCQ